MLFDEFVLSRWSCREKVGLLMVASAEVSIEYPAAVSLNVATDRRAFYANGVPERLLAEVPIVDDLLPPVCVPKYPFTGISLKKS